MPRCPELIPPRRLGTCSSDRRRGLSPAHTPALEAVPQLTGALARALGHPEGPLEAGPSLPWSTCSPGVSGPGDSRPLEVPGRTHPLPLSKWMINVSFPNFSKVS